MTTRLQVVGGVPAAPAGAVFNGWLGYLRSAADAPTFGVLRVVNGAVQPFTIRAKSARGRQAQTWDEPVLTVQTSTGDRPLRLSWQRSGTSTPNRLKATAGTVTVTHTTAVTDTSEHELLVSWDGTKLYVGLDGVLVSAAVPGWAPASGRLLLGATTDTAGVAVDRFVGLIRSVRVDTSAQTTNYAPTTITAAGAAAYWPLTGASRVRAGGTTWSGPYARPRLFAADSFRNQPLPDDAPVVAGSLHPRNVRNQMRWTTDGSSVPKGYTGGSYQTTVSSSDFDTPCLQVPPGTPRQPVTLVTENNQLTYINGTSPAGAAQVVHLSGALAVGQTTIPTDATPKAGGGGDVFPLYLRFTAAGQDQGPDDSYVVATDFDETARAYVLQAPATKAWPAGTTMRADVRKPRGMTWGDAYYLGHVLLAGVPIPAEFDSSPGAPGADGSAVYHDPASDELYELWRVRREPAGGPFGTKFTAAYGGYLPRVSQAFPNMTGQWGTSATSTCLVTNTMRLDEVAAGKFEHLLGCAMPAVAKTFLAPATRCDGPWSNLGSQPVLARLTADADVGAFTLTVSAGIVSTAPIPGLYVLNQGQANAEEVTVTAWSGSSVTVTPLKKAHLNGETVKVTTLVDAVPEGLMLRLPPASRAARSGIVYTDAKIAELYPGPGMVLERAMATALRDYGWQATDRAGVVGWGLQGEKGLGTYVATTTNAYKAAGYGTGRDLAQRIAPLFADMEQIDYPALVAKYPVRYATSAPQKVG